MDQTPEEFVAHWVALGARDAPKRKSRDSVMEELYRQDVERNGGRAPDPETEKDPEVRRRAIWVGKRLAKAMGLK